MNRFNSLAMALFFAASVHSHAQGAEGDISLSDGKSPKLPKSSLGPILDLDADKGVTLEDGDRVSIWKNQIADAQAKNFVKRDKGRKKAGSGRPTLKKNIKALNGHNSLEFLQQELVNMDEDAFDHLTQGSGNTWLTVLSVRKQRVGVKDVNSFFGNLKNKARYSGFWGAVNDDNTLWWGARNGLTFGRFDENNPQLLGPKLEIGKYYLIAGRMGAGQGVVPLELFVNSSVPVTSSTISVIPTANPSKMAIGQERDATQHPGKESFDGEIARFLIFDRPLSDTELESKMTELKKQYGISE